MGPLEVKEVFGGREKVAFVELGQLKFSRGGQVACCAKHALFPTSSNLAMLTIIVPQIIMFAQKLFKSEDSRSLTWPQ
eukprot:scaffold4854_cov16-Tisochrysis_lutea.AAC.4